MHYLIGLLLTTFLINNFLKDFKSILNYKTWSMLEVLGLVMKASFIFWSFYSTIELY